jgi:hypothetical protein
MPTKKFDNTEQAYQALTDEEIMDDGQDMPVAEIKVAGMHVVKIGMVSEYDYYYRLLPMREELYNYFLNKIAITEDIKDSEQLLEKMKTLVNSLSNLKTKKDIEEKAHSIIYLFEEHNTRLRFFKGLKAMGIVKWWVTWKRYQKCTEVMDTPLFFCYLWAHNFDGVKKKIIRLLQKIQQITAVTSSQSLTGLANFQDFESWKRTWQAAHDRLVQKEKLFDNSKN